MLPREVNIRGLSLLAMRNRAICTVREPLPPTSSTTFTHFYSKVIHNFQLLLMLPREVNIRGLSLLAMRNRAICTVREPLPPTSSTTFTHFYSKVIHNFQLLLMLPREVNIRGLSLLAMRNRAICTVREAVLRLHWQVAGMQQFNCVAWLRFIREVRVWNVDLLKWTATPPERAIPLTSATVLRDDRALPWCADGVRMAYGSCTDCVRIMYGWCTDIVRILYVWCT